ncbi:MAG: LmbU family transcriptional regulator [Actinomycetota bacterium]|nr:LmbU family transcriptional regulator [Actinomycetota bacterium]
MKPRAAHIGLGPGDSIRNLGADQGARAQRSGLFLPCKLSFEEWREIGSQIFLVANSCAWWVGDWLAYGENSFGDRYEQAIADTSLEYQTLRNYAWVAKKFAMSRRRDSLSFGHHAEVAALTEAEQDVWLARAERFNWSRNELRRRLRATRLANRPQALQEGETRTKVLKIDVAVERHDRWRHAAERMDCTVAEWIITTLDRAAVPES